MHVGQKLGPYELLAPIGAGGMGEVWKARDTRLDRTVAVKHSAERFSDRFEREAHAIAALNHPHICTLYDVGPDYLVMEFVEGKPLRGPLPLKQALELGAQIADALHCAHSKGIVHRDLKPGNILLTKSGVKLLDFGLAKVQAQAAATDTTLTIAQPLTAENAIIGTLQYMAPEQLEGRAADARSDIFALGLVLYEMICGQPAFGGKSQASLIAAILKEDPAPLGSRQPVTPPALERLVRKCLEKDPDERWQSAADLRDELRWLAEPGPQQETPSPPRVLARRWLLTTLAVICAAMLAFAAFRLFSPRAPTWSGSRLGGPELAFGPRISPDGTTLAFQAMVRQNMQVAVLTAGERELGSAHPQIRYRLRQRDQLVARWNPALLRPLRGRTARCIHRAGTGPRGGTTPVAGRLLPGSFARRQSAGCQSERGAEFTGVSLLAGSLGFSAPAGPSRRSRVCTCGNGQSMADCASRKTERKRSRFAADWETRTKRCTFTEST